MEFKTFQKVVLVNAAQLSIPDEIKNLVRAKQSQEFMGGKVRYQAPHSNNGHQEVFSLVLPHNTSEVPVEDGKDYVIEGADGKLIPVSQESFEAEFGLAEAEEEKPKGKKK